MSQKQIASYECALAFLAFEGSLFGIYGDVMLKVCPRKLTTTMPRRIGDRESLLNCEYQTYAIVRGDFCVLID